MPEGTAIMVLVVLVGGGCLRMINEGTISQ